MKFLKNLAVLLLSDSVSKIFSFLVMAYFARVLHPAGLGKFAWAQSLVMLLSIIPNFGLSEYGILQIVPNRSRENIRMVVGRIIGSRIVLGTLTTILGVVVLWLLPLDGHDKALLFMSLPLLFSSIFSFEWFYTAIEDQAIPGVIRIISRSLYLVAALLFVETPEDVIPAIATFGVTELLLQLLLIVYYRVKLGNALSVSFRGLKSVLFSALPLAIYTAGVSLFVYGDIVAIGMFLSLDDVGQFAGALRIVFLIVSIKYVVAQLLFPRIVHSSAESTEQLSVFMNSLHSFTLIGAFILLTALLSIGRQFVSFVLGDSFEIAQDLFLVMSTGLFAEFCWIAFPYAVVTIDKKAYTWIMLSIGVLKLGGIMLASSLWGVMACGLVFLFFNLAIYISSFLFLFFKRVTIDILRVVVLPLGGALAMSVIAWVLSPHGQDVVIPALMITSIVILILCEGSNWTVKELRSRFQEISVGKRLGSVKLQETRDI